MSSGASARASACCRSWQARANLIWLSDARYQEDFGNSLYGQAFSSLTSTAGSVFVTDLTLAMPGCEAVGDYLVLKNLVLDLNMAAAN